ncbi:MAG: hypothetical protein AAF717_14760 [Bacteroidota bacterium]
MDDFERLRNTWKEQRIAEPSEAGFTRLKNRIKYVTKKQKIGNVVLLSTIGVLLLFFFYIDAIAYSDVALALGAMILALMVRVLVEFLSIRHLKHLSIAINIQKFKGKLKNYCKGRIWVHTVVTPIILVIYCYAFWTLLPNFKASLSKGFYQYIVVSSLVLLVVFSFFISFQARKEMKVLKELRK